MTANVQDFRQDYATKFGFSMPDSSVFRTPKGLSEEVIRQISKHKNEPEWMLDFRLESYQAFLNKPTPEWGADLSGIDYDEIYYYLKPTNTEQKSWDDVPENIKNTFERLGVPQAEREFLSGVKAQYDSEVAYSSLLDELKDEGIIFVSTDEALKKYPELFKEYFGTVIPFSDNKFAALNSAVWSGGSFVYIPKGVHVKRPLQAYFRINGLKMGQFERTLIIADEGSYAHYVEGCFTAGHLVRTLTGYKKIEEINKGDLVLTHTGNFKKVLETMKRPYKGDLIEMSFYGDSSKKITATPEHPFMAVKRKRNREKNKKFVSDWLEISKLEKGDYLALPIPKYRNSKLTKNFEVTFRGDPESIKVDMSPAFLRLVGYYLAEGSVDPKGYLRFSFGSHETEYIKDVKDIIYSTFGTVHSNILTYKNKAGADLVFNSVRLMQIFRKFGTKSHEKALPDWAITLPPHELMNVLIGCFRGDGNYSKDEYGNSLKEMFRFSTVSEKMAYQIRDILVANGIPSFINARNREKEGRKTMFTVGVTGFYMKKLAIVLGFQLADTKIPKNRASRFYFDELENKVFVPIREIKTLTSQSTFVYNLKVEDDESYTCNGVAVHNCTSPVYTTDSLHAAVVEVIVKPNARFRYSTIQNWSNDVYNLVTKRARVEKNATMEWVDGNLGSKVTMKYPACYLVGEGAKGEVLSIAYASSGMHQDAGSKMVHVAPNTSSRIISKSISAKGGRTSYRGLVHISPSAKNCKSHVECDALILDSDSATDTFPVMRIDNSTAHVEHEATVSKVGEEKLFYLMSRGLTEAAATSLIISGFIEPIVKELPMEYAVELNRLIELEMEGSVG